MGGGVPLGGLTTLLEKFQTLEMNPGEYVRGLRPALDDALAMILAVGLVKWGSSLRVPMVAGMLTEITTGMVVYASTVFILHHSRILTFLRHKVGTASNSVS